MELPGIEVLGEAGAEVEKNPFVFANQTLLGILRPEHPGVLLTSGRNMTGFGCGASTHLRAWNATSKNQLPLGISLSLSNS